MRLTHSGFLLLLILGAANASAGQGNRGHDREEGGRPFLRNAVLQQSAQIDERQGGRQGELRRGKFDLPPARAGYDSQGDSGNAAQENSRRQGKLSPEERRTLRRQIDEAGHDIYSPRR